jgi:ABC-2 type transport system permease protein
MWDSLMVNLDDKNEAGQRLYNFTKHETLPAELDAAKKSLAANVDQGDLDGYIVIPASIYDDGNAEYYGKSVTNFRENGRLRSVISRAVTEKRIQRSGFNSEQIHQLVRRVELRTFRVAAGGQEQADEGHTQIVVWILVAFIYMAMLVYGQVVMRSIIEEKSSRVIESVISSLKPFQLMAGKIVGIGALGFTQYSIWALVMGLLSLYGLKVARVFAPKMAAANLTLPTVAPEILVFFVVFFVLGYLLFATMYAAVGAMVNSDQEAQQFVFPLIMLVILPFLFTSYIIGNPGSQMAVILSLIPFFTPIIMFARIIVQMPPAWQIALSLLLMVAAIVGMIWVVGRIYRIGVLMYGKRPTLPEIIKWIKYA